jgi:hypothetical protein
VSIRFVAIADETVAALRRGEVDANGQRPERRIAQNSDLPCRYCLADIQAGEAYLTLALRPFPAPQPYAEVGPIFLHADRCERGGGTDRMLAMLDSPQYIVRGYGLDDRIIYGTGAVVETAGLREAAEALLARCDVAYVHVRSATNNCYQCRIEPA